jgi:ADP-heptose:LPS heptosyltransferase
VCIHSAYASPFTSNREYYTDRFQEVIDRLAPIPFVQLGLPRDPLLDGCIDLRGLTLRECAAVLKWASLLVGQEGGLMHLAAAVRTPSVIVYGGFTDPSMTGYDDTVALVNKPPCAPAALPHPAVATANA